MAPRHEPVDPGVDIGHVHLKVSDLDRALGFYRDALGFEVMGRIGDLAAFVSAGGYHHHIGLNTFESRGGGRPPAGSTGLYHVAIRYPSRAALVRAVRRLLELEIAVDHASDHGANVAVYLDDPDGNGIELTYDRPIAEWPRAPDGELSLVNQPARRSTRCWRAADLERLAQPTTSRVRSTSLAICSTSAWTESKRRSPRRRS